MFKLTLLVAVVVTLVLAGIGIASIRDHTDNVCYVPCTIHFDQRSQEDDVFWDWRGNKTVYMWKGQH